MADLAKEAQELVAGLDPASAAVVAGMIVSEGFQYLLPTDVAKRYFEFQSRQIEEVKKGVLRSYISKRQAGEDVDAVVHLAEVIGKAAGFDGLSEAERRRNTSRQRRDARGQFITMNHKIRYSRDLEPMDSEDEDNLGIQYPTDKDGNDVRNRLKPEDRSRYQQAYQQIESALRGQRSNRGVGQLVVRFDDGHESRTDIPQEGEPLKLFRTMDKSGNIKPGKVVSAKVEITPPSFGDPIDAVGGTFNAVNAITRNPDFAAYLASGKYGSHLQPDRWSEQPGDAFISAAPFRRLQDGSNLLQAAVGPFLPASAQAGLSVGSFVGQYGPQAQQVFGPAMDRAKYRYKGTERKVDPALGAAFKQTRDSVGSPVKGGRPNQRIVRDQVINGVTVRGRNGTTREPSPVMNYMRSLLPSSGLSRLQRYAGHQPPSQGIIIDQKGNVSAQMVGHGEDWYLPFDLTNLGGLQGGSYIRTRGTGGLTTEDIYTGLMAGARSMSVVSRDGVHTLEFDDTLRGSRRYSSTARDMTERYGALLDAVKNGEVYVNDIDPSRKAELREEAGGDDDTYRALVANDRRNPTPSGEQMDGWLDDFMYQAAQNVDTARGDEYTTGNLYNLLISREAQRRANEDNAYFGGDVTAMLPSDKEKEINDELAENPRNIVAMMPFSMQQQWGKYQAQKTSEYRASLKPVTLNGDGYDFAMQALKEQFPYFIKSTKYDRWANDRDGSNDSGYVKPRFNRPEESQAGYFDASILGTGKVSADRTRYQNAGVMRRLGRNYEFKAYGDSRPSSGGSTNERPADTTNPSGGQQQTRREVRDASKLEREANLDLGKHLIGQTNFGKNVNIPHFGDKFNEDVKGGTLAVNRGWLESDAAPMNGEFKPFTLTAADLDRMSDEELRNNVGAMLKAAEKYNLFDNLDQAKVQGFRNKGAARDAPEWKSEIGETNDVFGEVNFNFGPDFAPGRTKSQYAASWRGPEVTSILKETDVTGIDDPELDDKLDTYISQQQELVEDRDDYDDAVRRNPGNRPPIKPPERAALMGRIQNAVRAKQLGQRWRNANTSGPMPPRTFIGGGASPTVVPPTSTSGGSASTSPFGVLRSGVLRPRGSG